MEKLGGRKFLLALLVVVVLLAVLLIASLTGKLETGLAGVIIGAVTWVLTQFGLLNVSATKAALAAGKAKDEETTRLAGMSDVGVLDRAGAVTGFPVSQAVRDSTDGAVELMRGTVDALRADGHAGVAEAERRVASAADEARERLRRAATPSV